MNCSKAQKMMIDYMDNQLGQKDKVLFEKHLSGCNQCRPLLAQMTEVVTRAHALKAVAPPEGAWMRIEKELAVRRRRPLPEIMRWFVEPLLSHRRLAMAVGLAVCLIILGGVFQSRILFTHPGLGGVDTAAVHHFQEAERHYQLAIEAIDQSLPDLEAQLPPDLAAEFRKNLEIIDNAILVCRSVIDRYPENVFANEQLLICYRKKFELLNEIQRVLS